MKLKTKLLMFAAATALSVNMAHAAIDGNALADAQSAGWMQRYRNETGG